MVDIVGGASAMPLRITIRPNSALHPKDALIAAAIAAPVGAVIAALFARFGAWPVAVFVALAFAGLFIATRLIQRRNDDIERIAFDAWTVTVDRHDHDGDSHYEFNGPWVQLVERSAADGGCTYLALRSQGREVSLGEHLTEDERASVSRVLRDRLRKLRS